MKLNPDDYILSLPEDRREIMSTLRRVILENIPEGFSETMSYGMLSYVVPLSLYPEGYLGNPEQPLPFLSLASQKNFISLYHMGIYANPDLLQWFTDAYSRESRTRPDMGKSCIRFRKPEHVPLRLIAELVSKMSVKEWTDLYEQQRKK